MKDFSHPPRFVAVLAAVSWLCLPVRAAVTITTDTLLGAGDASLENQEVIVDRATLTLAGTHRFASLRLANGAVLTHEGADTGQAERAIRLTVTGDMTVDAGARVDASGKGYAGATSPGAGVMGNYAGGGGGHGGRGHESAGVPGPGGTAFGSITAPDEWGGPGGNSSSTALRVPGGGLVHLEVGGTLTVAGAVRADGAGAWINDQGGGAGGTVSLKAGTLAGDGAISANGGGGEWVDGGGGAGGRIALFFTSTSFTGTIGANGAGGHGVGGAGTVYLKQGNAAGELRVSNEGRGEWTPLTSPVRFNLVLNQYAIAYATAPLTIGSLSVTNAALLTHATGSTGLVINASGNVTIGPQAAISADGCGYPFDGNRGPGTGVRGDWAGTGAGHAGLGGHGRTGYAGGSSYGSLLQPTALGSQGGDGNGGPGSAGGGAIRIITSGTLEVQGRLSASANNAGLDNAGGGSGGSIWVNAGTLKGDGVIVAQGGAGEWVDGGGGSGGRIALYYTDNQFAGAVTAYGGGGFERGGAGTIYYRRTADAVGELVVDNAGVWGNYTPVSTPEAFALTIGGRAVCYPEAALTVARFRMPSEAVLTHLTGQTNLTLHVTGDATLASSAQLTADGRGYPIGEDPGPGAGSRYDWGGSGGGHGGLGGLGRSGATGGGHYGSLLEPTTLGSQGGNADGGVGTAGGGAIRLIVDGKLTLDGRLSAEGGGAPPNNAGGGSGGSIWLTAGTLSGAGVISVNGAPGEWVDGGGGSGGRIAVYFTNKDYTGGITAFGGGGYQRGGAGTIYTKGAAETQGHLLVDNGTVWGNYTPLQAPVVMRATLSGRAALYPEGPLTFTRLELPGEAMLTQLTGQSNVNLHVLGDLIVGTNSTISVEGRGYPIGQDPGPGAGTRVDWGGSGGSHGGLGGWSRSGASPTTHYGSMLEPTLLGSQGGNADGGPGTAGGGAIRLVVDGTLTVDGSLNANGAGSTPGNAGGGAGGSIWLTTAKLAGSGSITVNGGPGEWVDGGGGSGGRIAVYYVANEFSGAITAFGGGGNQRGGAGTIYSRKNGSAFGQLLVNNGGTWGNYTPMTSPEPFQLTLAEMAYVYPVEVMTVRDLTLQANTTFTHLTGQARCEVTVLNDVLIAEGASLSVDGRGYPIGPDRGPGTGNTVDWSGSGAGHGGTGGRTVLGAVGGAPYGSITEPLEHGSAGGTGSGGAGGAGGGVIRLVVTRTLTVDGRLSANGLNGVADNSGGGAGGSVYLTANTLAGKGSILADGGVGEWVDGGSGGGGRIALYASAITFTGELFARGGNGGRERGGAGSVYKKIIGQAGGQLVLDNGGNNGALTPFAVPEQTQLVLGGGSSFYPTGPLNLVSLELKPGATLTHVNGQSGLTVSVERDLSIAEGAAINVDGRGYPVGEDAGPGAGVNGPVCGSGGAHGGNGGLAWPGDVAGGLAYGSILQPTDLGSGGGGGSGSATRERSPGGGAVRLIVGGTLTVGGTVSANGSGAWYDNQGGAAGGSIWLTANKLAGQGTISANGGNGEWVDGGSGGGGRIALYLAENGFTGTVQARGGRPGRQAGGAGTLYTKLAAETTGQVLIENGGTWGAWTPLRSPEPYDLRIAEQAQVYGAEQLVLHTLEVSTNSVLTHLKGDGGVNAVVFGDATIAGRVNADGQGYPVGSDPGPGVGGSGSWAGGGAGHGGDGHVSASGAAGGLAYGSSLEPSTPGSQGGAGNAGPGTDGGGVVRLIVGGTLTVDGSVTANALGGARDNAGGGSGGSILLNARALAGTGEIRANGGPGEWVEGGSGAGGRIAIYREASSFSGTVNADGAGGARPGGVGTVYESSISTVVWLAPGEPWLAGTVPVEVALFVSGTGPFTAEFSAWRDNVATAITNVPASLTASTTWDTTRVADGPYRLRARILDATGTVVAESTRDAAVNNSVIWHAGALAESATWSPGRVHVVNRELLIGPGRTLTLEPGVIVKFMPWARLTLQGNGKLSALGTAAQPISLTSFRDDTVGGDSNLDGDLSKPTPGSWRLSVNASATLEVNDQTRFRYNSRTYGGTLAGNEIWTADTLREITEAVLIPAGVTLQIEGGAIIKLGRAQGITVQAGGKLIARGSLAAPVVFTSVKDDAWGGDTNEDGSQTKPAPGDWGIIYDQGEVDLTHTLLLYGAGTVSGQYEWGAGALRTTSGAVLRVVNSLIRDAIFEGIHATGGGTINVTNTVIAGAERAVNADGAVVTLVNCTLYANRIGLWPHGGTIRAYNTIISHSIDTGIVGAEDVRYCLVWSSTGSNGNFQPGSNGNLSAEPKFKDPAADNFRLNYVSPGIDAADGARAPATDSDGLARYDDPRTGNTGTASANGAVPDLGAFEFAETAPSNLDLVVLGVSGPSQLTAGELVHVEWTVANRGAEAFTGPWHDAIYLRNLVSGQRIAVSEPVVGRGVTLGPGQSQLAGADVRVPGGVAGSYSWVVVGNSQGDIFEGANNANNESNAGSSASLSLPVIPLDGAPLATAFDAQEEPHWFQCLAPVGRDVRFDLDLASTDGVTELYVGRGFVPTTDNYSARQREWSAADTSAIVTGAEQTSAANGTNVFYVLAIGRRLSETPLGFKMSATSAAFSVESVWPKTVGNAGLVTLDIRGAAFTTNTTFAVRVGGLQRPAVRQSVRESGRVFATFDLAGLPEGKADLIAEAGGLQVALPEAFEVVAGGTPDFYVNLSGPGTTRAGRFMSWFVTYGNRGLVDLKLPLLKFSAPGATEIRLYDSTLNWADSFTFWGLNPEALLPTLGPGQEVTFEVRVKAMRSSAVTVAMMTGEAYAANATPFNWATLPPTPGADPTAWAQMVAGLDGRLGATLGEYAGLLEADLAELAAGALRYTYLANINGGWLLGDELRGVPEPLPIIEVPPEYEDPPGGPGLHGAPVKIPGDGIRKTWFVIITMEDYSVARRQGHPGAADTDNVAADSEDLWNYIRNDLRVPEEQSVGGHDAPGDQATWSRENILATIRSFAGKVDADDNLVIVYSGHGGRGRAGTGYLVGNGGDVSPVAFTQAINDVGAGTTYFINNSCHSEAFNELVNPDNTTFVGYAATKKDRIAWSDEAGSPMIAGFKAELRKCHGLGESFEATTASVTKEYEDQTDPTDQQHPVLTNPSGASLAGKPWNDPSGFEQRLHQTFRSPPFPGIYASATYTLVGSQDPNDKYALAGAGAEHWIGTDQVLPFEVVFENKATAAAPAQEVLVTDLLSTDLDWSTFELKTVAFNDALITVPPGRQRFYTTTSVGTDTNEVTVDVSFDSTTGRISWLMRSRDANTGDLPEDPFAGFLPPNDDQHHGEGSLTYTIRPKLELPDGTPIRNQATIIFDPTYGANPPILTPVVTNRVDSVAPTSQVTPLPASVPGSVDVSWSGADATGGSGIASFDVFVSRDNAAYQLWQVAATTTNATFTGQPGSTYRFYSVARDAAGNTETAPAEPDAVTTIPGGLTYESWAAAQGLPANANGPADDPDHDGLPNFAEYAYATNPLQPDSKLAAPKASTVRLGGQDYLAITYRRQKTDPVDVKYHVSASTVLLPWAGANTVAQVGTLVDRGTYAEATYRSTQPIPITAAGTGFLRLEITR